MADVLIPILRDTKDPHYRYKMPKLCAKVEGSGNGIKTVIVNMNAVAKSLGRPASYPTKYFGCELGAQVTMNNEYIVNGAHDTDKLLHLLYGFIQKFVLCSKCNNPETNLSVSGQSVIRQKCIACGHETVINKSLHKLTAFIISHPPEGASNNSTSSSKGKLKSKSSKSKSKHKNSHSSSPSSDHSEEVKNEIAADEFEDDFDEQEFSSDAYARRMQELCHGMNGGMYMKDSKESASIFYAIAKEKKEADLLLVPTVQNELVKEAELLNIRDKAVIYLAELVFTENILDEIKRFKMLLLRFCAGSKKAQKYLLGAYEKLVGEVFKEKLFPNAVKILKQFYDEDLVEEEVIIEWAAKESKKYVSKEVSRKLREKVSPLVKWLKEAEVEESDDEAERPPAKNEAKSLLGQQRKQSVDDDEEEDGIDLEFSHRVSGIQLVDSNVKPSLPNKPELEEEEIDIDNI